MNKHTLTLKGQNLSKQYGTHWVVSGVDLEVSQGEIVGLLGPNGAGKTTAMRMMLGLIRRDAGEIEILGNSNLTQARANVGAIVETPGFHGWTSATRNLEYAAAYANIPGRERKKEIARVLDLVGLTERAKHKVRTYSLGMKQRLAIARALMGRPPVLFLDEPTNGLDPKGMAEVRDLIRSLALNEQITVFISSHLLAEVQAICNRVGIIQKGTLRAEGTVEELLQSHSAEKQVEVGSTDPKALEEALKKLEGIQVVGAGTAGRLRIKLNDVTAGHLNKQLVSSDIEVTALVPVTTSLEDVFMEVTR